MSTKPGLPQSRIGSSAVNIVKQFDSDPIYYWVGIALTCEAIILCGILFPERSTDGAKTAKNNQGQSRIAEQFFKVVKQFDSDPD
jgi:hypothetical protein